MAQRRTEESWWSRSPVVVAVRRKGTINTADVKERRSLQLERRPARTVDLGTSYGKVTPRQDGRRGVDGTDLGQPAGRLSVTYLSKDPQ
jgi:hypothetical protein